MVLWLQKPPSMYFEMVSARTTITNSLNSRYGSAYQLDLRSNHTSRDARCKGSNASFLSARPDSLRDRDFGLKSSLQRVVLENSPAPGPSIDSQ